MDQGRHSGNWEEIHVTTSHPVHPLWGIITRINRNRLFIPPPEAEE